jgi:hypothetical protein
MPGTAVVVSLTPASAASACVCVAEGSPVVTSGNLKEVVVDDSMVDSEASLCWLGAAVDIVPDELG